MRTLTITILLFTSVSFVYSQQNQTESITKWEIGLDLLPFIDSSFSLKNTILIRKTLSDHTKLRGRMGLAFETGDNESNSSDIQIIDVISRNRFKGYFSIGHEWYVNKNNVSVFFGAESFVLYEMQVIDQKYDNRPFAVPPTITQEIDSYKSLRTGLKGIIGINIRLLPHLYLSPETFIEFAYRWERGKYELFEREERELTVYGGRTIKRFIVNVQPISAIHLVYQF